jgi:hypothetical protein
LTRLKIEWNGGGESRWPTDESGSTPNFESHRDCSRRFSFSVPARRDVQRAERIELQYRWARSAALTGTDIAQLNDDQMDYFRSRNLETVSIHVPVPLESVTLAVTVPSAYAPPSESWQVFVERPDGGPNPIEPNQELQAFVSVIPGGRATLTVPFPLPDYRYHLAWPVRPGFASDPSVEGMRDRARTHGQAWAQSIAERVAETLHGRRDFTAAIYVPEVVPGQRVQFRISGVAHQSAAGERMPAMPQPATIYRPRNEHDGLLGAWYGEASWTEMDPGDPVESPGLWPGEETVFLLPAYHVAWTRPTEPWGILRLGFGPGDPISDEAAERIALAATVVL